MTGDVDVRGTTGDVNVEMRKGDAKVSGTKGDVKVSGKGRRDRSERHDGKSDGGGRVLRAGARGTRPLRGVRMVSLKN